MTCHLINKAVVKQNCIKALSQHTQALEKSCPLDFHLIIIITIIAWK